MPKTRRSPALERDEVLRGGTHVRIRSIHPDDGERERRFIEGLSPETRRFRFLGTMSVPSEALLRQLTVIDPATDAAFVALSGTGATSEEIGVARFSARCDGQDCEFAVTVGDAWQHEGLGTLLMQRLIEAAKARGIKTMHSTDAADNTRMRQFADHLHFSHHRDPDEPSMVVYSVDVVPGLPPPAPRSASRRTAARAAAHCQPNRRT